MAVLKPFKAIRPEKGLTDRIAALPYDVYSRQEAYKKVQGDPYTFLRIDRPETQFSPDFDMYSAQVYEKAHELLWGMVERGEFVQDSCPCFYIYELTMDGRTQTGIVACASVDDYMNNVIKKHENTLAAKEVDRINHVDHCDAQTGPIFLAYRYHEGVQNIILDNKKKDPVFDFTAEDGIRHRGWMISDPVTVEALQNAFLEIPSLYIADGHHRAASAVKVSLMRREQEQDKEAQHEYDSFLSVVFADSELCIMDYNRYVRDLNGLDKEEFMNRIREVVEICSISDNAKRPLQKRDVSMYLDGKWYELTLKDCHNSEHPVDGLDVAILQNHVLSPILGIDDPKTDSRISFVGGIRGLQELERLVKEQGGVAFAMHPTSMDELFSVADQNLLMPPKSTWFEPKLRSGLFIHGLK